MLGTNLYIRYRSQRKDDGGQSIPKKGYYGGSKDKLKGAKNLYEL